jgi:hypothetical protein
VVDKKVKHVLSCSHSPLVGLSFPTELLDQNLSLLNLAKRLFFHWPLLEKKSAIEAAFDRDDHHYSGTKSSEASSANTAISLVTENHFPPDEKDHTRA